MRRSIRGELLQWIWLCKRRDIFRIRERVSLKTSMFNLRMTNNYKIQSKKFNKILWKI